MTNPSLYKVMRRTALFSLVTAGVLGCQSDPSQEDPNRTYFDGGALQAPEPMTIVLTGRVLKSQGRLVEAEYVLRRVTVEYPDFAPGYTELAELLLKDGRTREATVVLETGVIELPSSAILHNDLGICWLLADDMNRAAKEFTEARKLDPHDATYTANLAMVMGLQGRYDAAIALYVEVLPVADAHANVANLAEARGDSDRAQSDRAIAQRAAQ